jgi:hypothetical protein
VTTGTIDKFMSAGQWESGRKMIETLGWAGGIGRMKQ